MKKLSHEERKSRLALTLLVTFVVLAILIVIGGIVALVVMLLLQAGFVSDNKLLSPAASITILVVISIILGGLLSYFFSRITMNPVNRIITCFNQLANGNFASRLSCRGPLENHPTIRQITESFNTMAEELQNTELKCFC